MTPDADVVMIFPVTAPVYAALSRLAGNLGIQPTELVRRLVVETFGPKSEASN